jgi:beta-glucanase (GH16 family)
MKNFSLLFLLPLFSVLVSCGKDSDDGNNNTTPPSNLTLNAVVSTDNSGNVAFTASATNAVSYEFDFGNGIFQTSTSGVLTYKYPSSGTYTVKVTAKSAGGQSISKSIQITVAVALSLVWSDEFDTPGAPNPAKWGYDLGAGGWGNNELQYYTNRLDNSSVGGGTLKITAKAESFSGSNYTSARLLSKDKFSFKYGKVEARAKLPAGVGTWPAIWMLGSNIGTVSWPACGEIDIMEHRGSELNKIFGTLHYPGRSGGNADGTTTVISNASTEFHIYTVEWNASTIKIAVDNNVFFTYANTAASPFNQNFFLILNVAMGGNFGGAVDPAFSSAALEIDYIRVYQ